MMGDISIEFGALVRPIKSQLEFQGVYLPEKDVERFEKVAYSITYLHLQGFIPDRVRDSARNKLVRAIGNAIRRDRNPRGL